MSTYGSNEKYKFNFTDKGNILLLTKLNIGSYASYLKTPYTVFWLSRGDYHISEKMALGKITDL